MNEKLLKIQFIKENIAWIIPVAISILTALGYALAYFFEWGFCNEFGIPSNLIEVELSQVIIAVLRLTMVLGITLIIWYVYLYNQIKRAPEKLRSPLNLSAGLFLPVILYIVMYGGMWKEWFWTFVVVFALTIILILFASRKTLWLHIKTWFWTKCFQKLGTLIAKHIFRRTTSEVIKSMENNSKSEKSHKKLGENQENKGNILTIKKVIFLVVSIVFILFWASYSMGQADAKKQDKFLTISVPQYSAVLRIYGDNMICQPLNKSVDSETQAVKWTLQGNIFVIILSDTTEHILILEDTGRLIK